MWDFRQALFEKKNSQDLCKKTESNSKNIKKRKEIQRSTTKLCIQRTLIPYYNRLKDKNHANNVPI